MERHRQGRVGDVQGRQRQRRRRRRRVEGSKATFPVSGVRRGLLSVARPVSGLQGLGLVHGVHRRARCVVERGGREGRQRRRRGGARARASGRRRARPPKHIFVALAPHRPRIRRDSRRMGRRRRGTTSPIGRPLPRCRLAACAPSLVTSRSRRGGGARPRRRSRPRRSHARRRRSRGGEEHVGASTRWTPGRAGGEDQPRRRRRRRGRPSRR